MDNTAAPQKMCCLICKDSQRSPIKQNSKAKGRKAKRGVEDRDDEQRRKEQAKQHRRDRRHGNAELEDKKDSAR